eukprot:XP_001693895.1 flagellar/basal body protein [Chlamydomonas reinhardtii]
MVFPALVDWFSRPSGNTGCTTCGLFRTTNGTEIPVPLKRRDVSATVYADASFADTTENLRYKSDAECSAVFRFPLPPCAAVYRFRAVFGDREVVTKVKPRAAAREEYDFAVSQGHSAVHMSQHEAGASVFEVSLGNLAAHTEVTVEFSYLRLLDAFGGTLEWSHTATWVPPYVGSAGDVATGVDKVAAALPTFAPKVTYVLSYEVTVRAEAGTVRAIESPEPVTVERPMPGIKRGEEELWYVRLSEQVADPSKDLSLAIEVDPKAARRSGLRVQRTPASRGGEQRTVALATFVPPLPSPTAAGTDGKQQQLRKEICGFFGGGSLATCIAAPFGANAAPAFCNFAAAGAAASNVPELLSRLNLQRTTEGYWVASMELATLLGQTAESLAALHPRRPAGLTDDAWATVIVLGVLRRCLAAQREVWADMEAKALAWLAAAWPEGGRSVGSTVMALAKALTVLPKV